MTDVLLERSGFAPAIVDGIRALDRAGRAVLVGMGGDEAPIPLSVVQEKELTLTGTFRYTNTWPTAIALVASGRIDLDRPVTGSYGLDQVEEGADWRARRCARHQSDRPSQCVGRAPAWSLHRLLSRCQAPSEDALGPSPTRSSCFTHKRKTPRKE
jgi:Zinc-binding dehydrogenase